MKQGLPIQYPPKPRQLCDKISRKQVSDSYTVNDGANHAIIESMNSKAGFVMTQSLALCPLRCDETDWSMQNSDAKMESDPILTSHYIASDGIEGSILYL